MLRNRAAHQTVAMPPFARVNFALFSSEHVHPASVHFPLKYIAPRRRSDEDTRHELPPRLHHQADLLLGPRRVADHVRIPSARRWRPATSGGTPTSSPAIPTGRNCWPTAPATLTDEEAGLPQRPGRRALRHARRVEDQLGMARPAAGGLGLHQAPQILRHDHPEGVWRARLLALCAFRSGAQNCPRAR